MTNWLDVDEVRAALPHSRREALVTNAAERCVLEAIADLPEPKNECDKCHAPEASDNHKTENPAYGFYGHDYQPSTLHRIWRVARVVTGKGTP